MSLAVVPWERLDSTFGSVRRRQDGGEVRRRAPHAASLRGVQGVGCGELCNMLLCVTVCVCV